MGHLIKPVTEPVPEPVANLVIAPVIEPVIERSRDEVEMKPRWKHLFELSLGKGTEQFYISRIKNTAFQDRTFTYPWIGPPTYR